MGGKKKYINKYIRFFHGALQFSFSLICLTAIRHNLMDVQLSFDIELWSNCIRWESDSAKFLCAVLVWKSGGDGDGHSRDGGVGMGTSGEGRVGMRMRFAGIGWG